MSQVVECVPNFSEGRNAEIVDALAGVVRSVPGAVLLDYTKDPDHHRAVVTFAGRPYAVAEVAFQMVRRASQLLLFSKMEMIAQSDNYIRASASILYFLRLPE